MKKILIFISLFLIGICTINAQSVTANQVNGRLQMTTVSNVSDSTWSITGYFTNSVNKYLPSNINVNDKFFCQIGANTYVGRISVINSRSDVTKLITFRVICNYPNPPNNIGAIVRATSNGYPVYVDGLPNALQAGIQNYFASLIDTKAAGNPCEQTFTKTNHGFSPWTPVRWDGSAYVRPTSDTLVPDYIVVDSLSRNTFKVSTCGTYSTTLPDGLYWYSTSAPGYSLTPGVIRVPLFQVLDDKLILNPIVGFDLMSDTTSMDSIADLSITSGKLAASAVNWDKVSSAVKDSLVVYKNTTSEIASMTSAYIGQRLKLRSTGIEYIVRTDSVTGYPVDNKAIIHMTNVNKYALVAPNEIGYDIRAFGAIPDDGLPDDIAIQACIDFCILEHNGVKNSVVVVPPGNWRLNKGLVICDKASGAYTFASVDIIGTGVSPYSGEQGIGRQSIFEVRNADGFGIGIVKGRNIVIKGIAFNGYAPMTQNVGLDNILEWTEAQWTGNGTYRNNGYSPYAGIVIDFPTHTLDSDAYPDFAEYYGSVVTNSGGSSMITIDNCAIAGFMVGIMHSPSKYLQNGDNLRVSNIYGSVNKSFIAVGQDQTRAGNVDNVYALFNEVLLDCRRYGRQIGTPPALRNFNIAGGHKTLILLNTDNRANFSMTDCYGELVWQLIQGNATPTTFTNCAFDFQLWRPQPDFHIRSNANFINSILKFYGEEASHSLFVDGYCQFTQCVIGARGVFGPYTNGAGEQTERISLIDCTSTGQGWESNRISQTKTRGNQLLGTNTNFMQSLGCPVEGNRVSGTAGIIEVFNQPLYNTQAYGSTPLKVSTITNEAYLVSSSARGKVAVGDVLTSYTNFPVKTIPVDISSQKTPLGTVESVSGDTIFLKYNSIPFTLKDTTIGTWLNMYLPGSNLPFIGSGISGNTYLIVKTPWQFVGSLRPNGPGISPGTYVTRVSASNDTLHLSTALTSTVTNGYYSFFNSRKTGVDRSNEELVYNIGDEVVENGTKYIVTVPGKVGTSVPPTFTPALSAGSSLTADQVAIGNGSSNPLTGSSNVVYTGGQFRIGNPTSDGFTSLQVNGQTNVKRGFYVDRTAGNLASYYNILVRDAGEAGGLGTGLLGQTEMFAYNTGGLAIGTHNGGPLVLASAGTPRMTLNTTGVIDIGTSILKASSPTGTAMFVAEKAGASENKAAISDEGLYLSRTSDGGYLGFVGRDPNWSTPGNGDVVIRYSAARHYFYHANSGALLMSIMPGTNPITTSVDAIMSISHVQFKNFIGLSNEAPYFYSDDATGSTTNGFTFERSNRAASGNAGIVTWKFSGSEMARLTTSGSLALGTNAPVAKLHVVGDCVITSSLWLNDTKTVGLLVGTGSPEGAVTASVGSTFSRTDGGAGTSFYVKESGSGNTGWIAK